MANLQSLQRQGWYLSPEGLASCMENANTSTEKVMDIALNCDLKDIGEKHLPDGINKKAIETVDGPFVVQIVKIRNVSAPKENEESQAAPPLFKLTLTDGHNTAIAIEIEKIPNLGLQTAPGTKLKLLGKVPVEQGHLLLKKSNAKVLGGRVDKLFDNWELKKSLASQGRTTAGGANGPPVFVPFGQKNSAAAANIPKAAKNTVQNFRSLETKDKGGKEENAEFQAQREAAIAQIQKTHAAAPARIKSLVGSKQDETDKKVAQIMEMGFSAEDAQAAVRQHPGNVQDAINSLLGATVPSHTRGGSSQGGYRGGGGGGRGGRSQRANGEHQPGMDRERGERGGGRRSGGRGDRGETGDDDEFQTRPSAPATLFDFIKTIPSSAATASAPASNKTESRKEERHTSGDSGPRATSHHHQTPSSYHPAGPQDTASSTASSTGRRSISEDDGERRTGPTNLPPRLQKLQDERQRIQDERQKLGNGGGRGGRRGNEEYGGRYNGGNNPGMGGPGGPGGQRQQGYDRGPRGYDRGPRGYDQQRQYDQRGYEYQDNRYQGRRGYDHRYEGHQGQRFHQGYNQGQDYHQGGQRGYRGPMNRGGGGGGGGGYDQRNNHNNPNNRPAGGAQNPGGYMQQRVYQNGAETAQVMAAPMQQMPPPLMQQPIPPPPQAIISRSVVLDPQQQQQQAVSAMEASDPAIQAMGSIQDTDAASSSGTSEKGGAGNQDSDNASSVSEQQPTTTTEQPPTQHLPPPQEPPQQFITSLPVDASGAATMMTSMPMYIPATANGQAPTLSAPAPQYMHPQQLHHHHLVHQMHNLHVGPPPPLPQHLYQYAPAANQGVVVSAAQQMPPHSQPQQVPGGTDQAPSKQTPAAGDLCQAKYYPENLFYRAVVDSVDAATETAMVTFLDYGNSEKVNFSDIVCNKQWEPSVSQGACMVQAGAPSSMPGFLVQGPPQMAFLSAFPPSDPYGQQVAAAGGGGQAGGQVVYVPTSSGAASGVTGQEYMQYMVAVSQQHHMQQQQQQQ